MNIRILIDTDWLITYCFHFFQITKGKEQVFGSNSISKSQEIALSSSQIKNIPLLNGNSANNDDEFPNSIEELELLEADANRIPNDNVNNTPVGTEKNKKRTFDELFGDIKDLLDDDIPFSNGNN